MHDPWGYKWDRREHNNNNYDNNSCLLLTLSSAWLWADLFPGVLKSCIDTALVRCAEKNIAALFSIMDLGFLMRFWDLLAAEEKGPFTAHTGSRASLPQRDQPCLVPEPAPREAAQLSPQPPSCGGILLALCWSPRSWAVASDCEVPSKCLSCSSRRVGPCQAPPCSALPWPLTSESPECRRRSSISGPSVFHAAAAATLWPSWTSLPRALEAGAPGPLLSPHAPRLLPVVLQAPKGRAVSHKGHILLPGPAPALSPPLKQTAECREDRMACW